MLSRQCGRFQSTSIDGRRLCGHSLTSNLRGLLNWKFKLNK
jgi:hypothetical protein